MPYTNEIQEYFAGLRKGRAHKLSIPEPTPAWVLKMSDWYGVAIPSGEIPAVCLHFSNSTLKSTSLEISGKVVNVLLLYSSVDAYRNEFATVCAQFVNPGEEGLARKALIEDPISWWNRWRSLLGNRTVDDASYATLAELLTYEALIKADRKPAWGGANGSTHDIETCSTDYEVKATTKRYGTQITLSSQFQMMDHGKDLFVVFYRFEPALNGESVDTVVQRLIELGEDEHLLEARLKKVGLEKGSFSRKDTYHCLEMRKYTVDDEFPVITEKSFTEGKFPDALISFTYTVTLDGLTYDTVI